MTLGELLTDLYADLGYAASPPAAVTTLLTRDLNKAHKALLREPSLTRLRDTLSPLTFASVADQAIYGLPTALERIRVLTERDNDREIEPISIADLRRLDPGLSSTGTPWAYVELGYRPVQAVPASTGIWAVSSSAADTTQTITINGVRSAGLPTGDVTATMTGTSRVALGTLTDYIDVTGVSLSAAAAGVVSLYDASTGGTELAQIPIGARTSQYVCIQLYPTPTGAITYYVDGTMRIVELDDSQDSPMLPEEFHDLLAAYARMREYERKGDSRLGVATDEWLRGLNRLKHYVSSQPGRSYVLGTASARHTSRYGPWYPASK